MKVKILIIITLGLTLIQCFKMRAQTPDEQLQDYYASFDQVQPNDTDFLLNRGFIDSTDFEASKLIWESEHSGYVITQPLKWRFMYQQLQVSDINPTPLLADIETFWDVNTIDPKTNTTIPIGILNVNGAHIGYNAIDQYFDENTEKFAPDTPYENIKIFAASNVQEAVYQGDLTFTLNPQLYFTNTVDAVTGIEIDFDDGNGYTYYNFDEQNILVSYAVKGEKSIRYKLYIANDTLLSHSKLDVKMIAPLVPAQSKQITMGKGLGMMEAGKNIAGGSYETFLGCDNKLDKPIIIVEGFDPLQNRQPNELIQKYKDIGIWNNLSEAGYDLVALKFSNNHDLIQNNAQVLKTLINEINTDKEGHFENIIIGESMGGLVTRVALAQMEADGIDHETGLYVSFDAPHKGANVPLGMQFLGHDLPNKKAARFFIYILKIISFLTFGEVYDGINTANDGINNMGDAKDLAATNDVPVSRQMLIRHRQFPHETNPDFLNFQNLLDATGYPSDSRNIALINGSDEAKQQSANDGNNTLDIGEKYIDKKFGSCFLRLYLDVWVSPVNTYSKVSDVETKLFCKFKITNKNRHATFDDKPWDISPGGFSGALGYGNRDKFSFVPTVSAIDLDQAVIDQPDGLFYFHNYSGDATRHKAYIVQNNLTPFDDIYSRSANSYHINGMSFLNDSGYETLMVNELELIEQREIMYVDMYLQHKTIKNGWSRDFEANNSITAGNDVNTTAAWGAQKEIETGDFIIESGANTTFTAGSSITLSPGFHVQNGATFHASIASGNGNCNQPNGKPVSPGVTVGSGYPDIFPLPQIGIHQAPENDEVVFDMVNYSHAKKGVAYQWVLRGEGVEIHSNQKSFEVENLRGGQYSVTATVNNTKSRSKIFVISSNQNPLNKGNVKNPEREIAKDNIIVYPNPSSGELNLRLPIDADTSLKISIVDLNGRTVKTLYEGFRTSGDHNDTYDISGLSAGHYLVKIEVNNLMTIRKLIVE